MSENAIRGSQCKKRIWKPLQSPLPQTFPHRISYQQRADQSRATDRSTEHDTEMGAGMKAQAAADERSKRHDEGRVPNRTRKAFLARGRDEESQRDSAPKPRVATRRAVACRRR